ncbi:MAG TPA: EAL domain-containing protein, partial [Leucothrix sp.]|nr:EAL domain-containing protein [Leucothrix sp.]
VENQNILNILREMGVDYGQGYYIQRPGPFLEVAGHHMKISNEK